MLAGGCRQADVGGNTIQPGSERAAAGEAGEMAPGPQQGLLQGVFGILNRAQHTVAVQMQLTQGGLSQPAERLGVTGRGGGQVDRCGCAAVSASGKSHLVFLPSNRPPQNCS